MKIFYNEIRDYADLKKVKLYEVAEEMNLQKSNFSRLIAKSMTEETKDSIYCAIDRIAIRKEKIGNAAVPEA